MSEKEEGTLQPIWSTMLATSLKQTLILSYLNKKFPGSIQEISQEFSVLSQLLTIQPEIKQDIAHTLSGLPKTNEENNPFNIISNEIMTDTIIQTLMLRYFIKSNPDMAQAMLGDFQLIAAELNPNDAIRERVISSLSEFLPAQTA